MTRSTERRERFFYKSEEESGLEWRLEMAGGLLEAFVARKMAEAVLVKLERGLGLILKTLKCLRRTVKKISEGQCHRS